MIRKIQKSDYTEMANLIREFMVDYNAKKVFRGMQSDYMEYKDIESIIDKGAKIYCHNISPKKTAFVFEENHKLLAYISGEIKTDDRKTMSSVGYIEDWFVSKKYRGKRIGTLLYNQMLKFFKEHDVKIITLSVFNQNKPSYRLYEKMGFKPLDTTLLKRIR